jgi:hypothetical protein
VTGNLTETTSWTLQRSVFSEGVFGPSIPEAIGVRKSSDIVFPEALISFNVSRTNLVPG